MRAIVARERRVALAERRAAQDAHTVAIAPASSTVGWSTKAPRRRKPSPIERELAARAQDHRRAWRSDRGEPLFSIAERRRSGRYRDAQIAEVTRKARLIILFVCSGGRIDPHPETGMAIGLAKQILARGSAAVIGPACPIPFFVAQPWLDAWLDAFLKAWKV